MTKTKTIQAELKGLLSNRFELIKAALGMEKDDEVIRFLIQYYFRENLEQKKRKAKEEVKEDQEKIEQFMTAYGKEWQKLGE